MRSVLTLLASDGKPVCIDDATQDRPLVIFREMTLAPKPARRPLQWYPPLPLRPSPIAPRQAAEGEAIDKASITIAEPGGRRNPLPGLDQYLLRGAALRLSKPLGDEQQGIDIRKVWLPTGVTARWWPLNRMAKDCEPLFAISDPVRGRDFAFVSVRADHWGTLYALKSEKGEWKPVAEWSRWLY